MAKKFVYLFNEGNKDMRALLGGKGANLAEMTKIGLPVPQGFTITTEAATNFSQLGHKLPDGLLDEAWVALHKLEEHTGKTFGDTENPLLVSVRSGAAISMPGMMDTVLNLGLNDVTVKGFAKLTGDERFALDCYRRFIQMYANVVMGVDSYKFDNIIEKIKSDQGVKDDYELNADSLKELIELYKGVVAKEKGVDFPQDPKEQLVMAITAVFDSWGNNRAIVYRRINKIPDDIGTAVNVQSMVFGTWAQPPVPALPSRATLPLASRSSTANTSSMRRAKTSFPACARHSTFPVSQKICQTRSSSSPIPANCLKNITPTCRILNSPSKTASFTCSSAATQNARWQLL